MLAAARNRAARGTTVIAILHDLNLAARAASRIVVLDRGRIESEGRPAETITETMIMRVFGVTGAVGLLPVGETPFILPQAARTVLRLVKIERSRSLSILAANGPTAITFFA